jgi:hypothetical protein
VKAFVFSLCWAFVCVGHCRAADAIDIGDRKQVLWDDALLESREGVRFEMNPAVRTGEVDLVADKPWEAWMTGVYGTVIKDGDKFRMWYSARASIAQEYIAYAESSDGVHWQKPELGLIDFRGSKANNLLTPRTIRPHGGSVWIDPNAKPEERYKFIFAQYPVNGHDDPAQGRHVFLTQAVSADGIHVTLTSRSILEAHHGEQGVAFDTHNICFWDDILSKYVLYTRKRPARSVGRAVSDDPMSFPLPENVIQAEHWEDADYYSPGVFRYREADHAYVSLLPVFFHPMEKNRPADHQPMMKFAYAGKAMEVPPPDSLDVHLWTSRDGIQWQPRGDGRPVMRLGPEGSFDSRQIYPFTAYVAVGDEIWIYYLGLSLSHSEVLPGSRQGVVSRAVFRRDGFVSADAGSEGGTIVTKPLKFAGRSLEMNVDCSAGGHLDVEVLDEDNHPIPGFTAADHNRIYYNNIYKQVTFGGKADLSALAGRTIRLRFRMRDCKLYSFQFLADAP